MKPITLFISLFMSYFSQSVAQNKNYTGPFHFEARKGIKFHVINVSSAANGLTETYIPDFKLSRAGFRFEIARIGKHADNSNVLTINFPNYDSTGKYSTETQDKKLPAAAIQQFIGFPDNGRLFWMYEEEFDKNLSEKLIVRRYRAPHYSFSYGTNFSIPFKMRPDTGDEPMRITPEFSLGGYVGLRARLSHYHDFFLTIPVVTLGVTTIGINDNNVIKESLSPQEETDDGLVLGRTFSIGTVLEYEGFQVGFVAGWDKAGGDIGKRWIYNDRLWYSFSIGFSFLGGSTEKKNPSPTSN